MTALSGHLHVRRRPERVQYLPAWRDDGISGHRCIGIGVAVAVAGPIVFVAPIAGPVANRLLGPAAGSIAACPGCCRPAPVRSTRTASRSPV
ncbi:MAG TPA: hypothetical protein VN408_16010 [Actinoplanes sp.]|nr:hypothetical protein [Actinoplanes sp.]